MNEDMIRTLVARAVVDTLPEKERVELLQEVARGALKRVEESWSSELSALMRNEVYVVAREMLESDADLRVRLRAQVAHGLREAEKVIGPAVVAAILHAFDPDSVKQYSKPIFFELLRTFVGHADEQKGDAPGVPQCGCLPKKESE